ncbi:MAG: HesA/MoeB/ThiF family protein [Spirochaetes bacterium]|nr:MAG: HesA/MoeB/ThiF family protein [Spirochaetota bacterium]
MVTAQDRARYARQMIIPGWGEAAQEKLARATVFIAGCGGLGSPVSLYLAAAGVGTIIVCDSDSVEITNLNRQLLHDFSRIGTPKSDSAFKTLSALNAEISIVPVREKITKKNAASLIRGAGLIMDCLDNFETRHILNLVSVREGIPLVHAGIEGMQGQVTFLQPPLTPCLACFQPESPGKKAVPVLGATAGILGSLQALEAIKYITGLGTTLANRLLFWDGAEIRWASISISRNPKCKVCRSIHP